MVSGMPFSLGARKSACSRLHRLLTCSFRHGQDAGGVSTAAETDAPMCLILTFIQCTTCKIPHGKACIWERMPVFLYLNMPA